MLRINLLPTKGSRKHDNARNEMLGVAGLFVAVIVGLGFWHLRESSQATELEAKVVTVNEELSHLKQDVVRVEEFKSKADTYERKIKVITDLQKMRVGPARMLDDLAMILTEQPKVWLLKMTEKGGKLTIEGQAMEEENISDFQMALERRSKFFSGVHLDVVRSVVVSDVSVLEWQITCTTNYTAG